MELDRRLGARLIARTDAYAIQTADSGYVRKTERVTLRQVQAHIAGDISIGHYLIDPADNATKMFAIDIDPDEPTKKQLEANPDIRNPRALAMAGDPKVWGEMIILAQSLCEIIERKIRCRPLVSYGGAKGLHVIAPVKQRTSALHLRKMGEAILSNRGFASHKGVNFWKSDAWPDLTLEIFPKQVEVDDDSYGNLMRLPLGVNPKTGREAYFLPQGVTMLGTPDDPEEALEFGTCRDL